MNHRAAVFPRLAVCGSDRRASEHQPAPHSGNLTSKTETRKFSCACFPDSKTAKRFHTGSRGVRPKVRASSSNATQIVKESWVANRSQWNAVRSSWRDKNIQESSRAADARYRRPKNRLAESRSAGVHPFRIEGICERTLRQLIAATSRPNRKCRDKRSERESHKSQ